jgi:hypothetical protein
VLHQDCGLGKFRIEKVLLKTYQNGHFMQKLPKEVLTFHSHPSRVPSLGFAWNRWLERDALVFISAAASCSSEAPQALCVLSHEAGVFSVVPLLPSLPFCAQSGHRALSLCDCVVRYTGGSRSPSLEILKLPLTLHSEALPEASDACSWSAPQGPQDVSLCLHASKTHFLF